MKTISLCFPSHDVLAFLAGTKTVFRVPINPQPTFIENSGRWNWNIPKSKQHKGCCKFVCTASREWWEYLSPDQLLIAPSDVIAVKETWRVNDRDWDEDWLRVGYQASPEPNSTNSKEYTKVWSPIIPIAHEYWPAQFNRITDRSANKWRSAQRMPLWAVRLRLPVLSVRVERLQDITEEDAILEGAKHWLESWRPGGLTAIANYKHRWNARYGKKFPASSNPWVLRCEVQKGAK